MGEWSEYFEDFPEENPANDVGERFDPKGAQALRDQEAKTAHDQAKLDPEIAAIIQKHRQSAKQKK